MATQLLIKNGYIIDPKSGKKGNYDILTKDGKIQQIAEHIAAPAKCKVIDAENLMILPGLVDVHVHFRDPGFTAKEDIETGAKAAAKGGFTSVVLMANTNPHVDNLDTLQYVMDKGGKTAINVYTCANVTMDMKGKTLTNMEELAAAGAVGFTDDGVPIMDEALVTEAMERCAKLDLPISFHEEDPSLIENNGVNRGKASEHFGIGGSPREAEIVLIDRDLQLAMKTGAAVDIQHISTKEGVELVRKAKAAGANVHAEATPHHFSLTEEAAIMYGTLAKMNPPLRTEEDRLAIIAGLADGTIDMIATDHAPHTKEEKAQDITKAPSGIIGLETALPLAITKLVQEGYLTMEQVARVMSLNPSTLYHLDAGYIGEGGPADLVLIATSVKEEVAEPFASKASNTPFTGYELTGKVMYTICKGEVAYKA